MKVLAWVHLYPPDHCAGAEMMLHETLLYLQEQGHEVKVICNSTSAEQFETVPVIAVGTKEATAAKAWADIVITHLDRTRTVMAELGKRLPVVHFVHNDQQLRFHGVRPQNAALVVYNSRWLYDRTWKGRKVVLYPPVQSKRYATERTADSNKVTLINLSQPKGAEVFWQLANNLPEVQFLGVMGGYAKQIVPDVIPPNVTVHPHTSDITEVYKQTRLLLMPSDYESWGRVAIEAAASGIPTIANATSGLVESLSYAGTFVSLKDSEGWADMVKLFIEDQELFTVKEKLALRRSAELDKEHVLQLQQLEAEMLNITYDWGNK